MDPDVDTGSRLQDPGPVEVSVCLKAILGSSWSVIGVLEPVLLRQRLGVKQ